MNKIAKKTTANAVLRYVGKRTTPEQIIAESCHSFGAAILIYKMGSFRVTLSLDVYFGELRELCSDWVFSIAAPGKLFYLCRDGFQAESAIKKNIPAQTWKKMESMALSAFLNRKD